MEGVDYSTARPNLTQLWDAGKRFTARYLAYLPNKKVLDATERAALHTKGFGILLNWEQSAGDMLQGRAKGLLHATEALKQARALGAPASVPIYFSCDVDTTSDSQRAAVAAYLDGCASVLGASRVGVYGEADVIDAMLPVHAAWGWQTYAWSGKRVSAKAHVLQYDNGVQLAGGDVDLNRTLKDNFGAWWPGNATATGDEMRVFFAQDGAGNFYRCNGFESVQIPAGRIDGDIGDSKTMAAEGAFVLVTNPGWGRGGYVRGGWSEQGFGALIKPATAPPVDVAALVAGLAPLLKVGVSAEDVAAALESDRGQAALVKAAEFAEDH